MFRIKRLYSFILETFFPLLLATFSVCLFILLMQFLWKYVDDMVGKGVEFTVLGEMFFYAALSLIPMSLPLAILLASLMTFGNLGEHLELLAMKASGISLIRIMRPLIILMIVIAGVAFVFQNNILPPAQAKLWTIVLSLKQKSPELDIPEGIFYKEITGYNVYVRNKDKKSGMLRDMMIYDYSDGFENAVVTVADSGRLKVSDDKKYLIITLHSGESFQNLNTNNSRSRARGANQKIPYRRETFGLREVLIEFDTNFNMADESIMQNRDLGKNINQLTAFIDSVRLNVDSVSQNMSTPFKGQVYSSTFKQSRSYPRTNKLEGDTIQIKDFDSFFKEATYEKKIRYIDLAKSKVEALRNDYFMTMNQQSDKLKQIRGHQIELHKKFTLSLGCLLFFFIGAPLGAIIRKGGLGMPVVLSVFIFLFYFIIDTFGVKLAKQGVWSVWEGMWISSAVLAILGAFFTYKAVNDSVMMNPDAWKDVLQKIIGKREVRNYQRKDVIMDPPKYQTDLEAMTTWDGKYNTYMAKNKKAPFYISFWKKGLYDPELSELINSMEKWIADLTNSDENLIVGKLMDYPVIKPMSAGRFDKPAFKWFFALFFPLGIILYIIGLLKQRQIKRDLATTYKVNQDLQVEIEKMLQQKIIE